MSGGERASRRLVPLLVLVWGLLASEWASAGDSPERRRQALQERLDEATEGEVIHVEPGVVAGPLVVSRSVKLLGKGVTIAGGGVAQVVRIDAPRVELRGFRIEHSGTDLGGPDACLYLTKKAESSLIVENELRHCAFGMWVHEAVGVKIKDNRVVGSTQGHRSERGNGIHLFNASDLVIARNHVSGGRDGIYVSATEESVIENNRIEGARYGVHYMFSYSNELRKNVVVDSMTGYALMESHHIRVLDNAAERSEERGILFRDVQYCHIEGNRVVDNGEGLFFFSSTENTILGNEIRGNKIGAKIWAGTLRNHITENRFIGNAQQVFYVGSSDLLLGEKARGNFWSDYLGWDQDGDGVGDRPYRVDSFSARLTHRYPVAVLLQRSPALELLSHLQEDLPLLSVPTVIDRQPLSSKGAEP